MYSLSTSLSSVKGVGPQLTALFAEAQLHTIHDLLLYLPLRYFDFSQFVDIAHLVPGQAVTIEATVQSVKTFYKNRRPITSVIITDDTGKCTLWWFNNTFVSRALKKNSTYYFSGTVTDKKSLVQPSFEKISDDTTHTGRVVPQYSQSLSIPQGTIRRILKECVSHLETGSDVLTEKASVLGLSVMPLAETLQNLHFPADPEAVIAARERLALEELIQLMYHSNRLKKNWAMLGSAAAIPRAEPVIAASVPFTLTQAQDRCLTEILSDLEQSQPMNRMLVGDVGSGKTIVAGLAALQVFRARQSTVLVAPTRILAEQHFQTIQKILPELPVQLLTGGNRKKSSDDFSTPQLIIGTHAILNVLEKIAPAFIIFDEQHRFGVLQRSSMQKLVQKPHVLTMTATPIPRSLLLTLFAHMSYSVIDELPKNRIPTKTWLVPEDKRTKSYDWLLEKISASGRTFQALIVCPFINTSVAESLENVASAQETFEAVKKYCGSWATVTLLHGKQKSDEKTAVIQGLTNGSIDIVVTTSIVEVGIDLPQASAMIIEGAERYGLSSLHQLRGRVGRAGQQGYCMLFTTTEQKGESKKRLQQFTEILSGQKLAELDLGRRGAGDLFGTAQHGFGTLQYANWTNLTLVAQAQQLSTQLEENWQGIVPAVKVGDVVPLGN